ncbi:MAG: hypothetical protein EAZ97_04735 [Bacteroidetes bacterium]|nr:MAG: hypothetical protein EAZ97_04735 [Bacteroidota bacterium]
MQNQLQTLFEARKNELFFYSPYNFFREIDAQTQINSGILPKLEAFAQAKDHQIIEIEIEKQTHLFFVQFLAWDTDFFKFPTYKLFAVLYDHQNFDILKQAIKQFLEKQTNKYLFIEIPSEDVFLMQALSSQGFKLTETRYTYFRNCQNLPTERFAVRKADLSDIDSLRKIASEQRNNFDRFHADPFFSRQIADDFLAKYIENSVKGYADLVLIPDLAQVSAFAAMAFVKEKWHQISVGKIILTASGVKGWHYNLVSECLYHIQNQGLNYAVMVTQSTNRAVIRNCEKLGFSLGACSHVLSLAN